MIRVTLRLQCTESMLRLSQLCFGSSRAHHQLGAAFFVVTALGRRSFALQLYLVETLAVLANLGFDGVSTLGAVGMLCFELLDSLGTVTHFLREGIDSLIKFDALAIELCELAGQHQTQLGAHLVSQLGVA